MQNKNIIYKIAHAYCRNAKDRNDLAQEIIMQLWKSFAAYDPQYRFSTWMYRLTLNVAISFYRREEHQTQRTGPLDEHLLLLVDDRVLQDELAQDIQQLYRFINELDELNRAIMLLYLDAHSYKEIADIPGIAETNAATKINRIEQKLKAAFSANLD
jgi:RNA polymerase sigma-70 factor (ECF subfamily)